jgi:hypothetical protein
MVYPLVGRLHVRRAGGRWGRSGGLSYTPRWIVLVTRTICATFRKMISKRYINKSEYGVNLMWLPEKFYELLPYLYTIGGVIAISSLDTPLAYISGCLLIFTGGVIFMMRRDYRQGRVNKKN